MMTDGKPFRVIIAGGSVVGLFLANVLERAGIDFLVLEKGDIAPRLGASISVLCQSARVFEQLGMWKTIQDCTVPLLERLHYDENGRMFEDTAVLRIIAEKTKRPFAFVGRHTYLDILLSNIVNKSWIRDRIGVHSYVEDDDGVTVTTDKGEEIRGSILVGADGVHSTIHQLMMDTALTSPILQGAKIQGQNFTSTYRCIFGTSKNQRGDDTMKPFLADGMVHNVYYRDVSGVVAAGVSGFVFWFLYVKEDASSTTPNCPRYTEADAQATMDSHRHLAVGPNYNFGDLWEARVRAIMVPMEEGVVQGPWNNGGRVVLMGDCIAKSTVNPGLGGNTHLEGVCHFVNELKPLLEEHPSPTKPQVLTLFQRYEELQRPRTQLCVKISGYVTRFEAMATWYWRFARILSPWIPDSLKAKGYLDFAAQAPILHFLPDPDAKD